ncbi:polar amino acid transport system substrate-binding protein [Pseudoxanthobacter soli DSM 19599]|uniref:Polar amino acid transport system substrate-binding protein n=1 Tax=Pseudoxanthobacter soli DSM 19599 TaxID=1123029 RepID=A0A1M7ZMJ1_9HYPH|nr:transporter substrate-binding domain-containing protein [Pseudoxanthobacter soli]SHO66101.1 polar amino acid transport system substrate-binding protein [Pseudoxanthobacter soli DSM 19599]
MITASSIRPSPAIRPAIRHLVLLLVGAFVLALSSLQSAFATDPNLVLDRIRNSGELRVPVMVGEEPGYVRNRDTGEWGGFYMDWAKDIAELLNVKVVPVETTWGNLAADFQANKIDIAFGLNPNPKRGLVVDYLSVPLFTDAWAIVTKPGFTKKTWAELNDPSVRLVVQKGGTMQVVAESLTPKATITPVEDRPLGVMELQAGRADAMILAVFDAIEVAKQINGEIILPSPMLLNPATIGVRREEGNEGYENWLTNWVNQQRALGLAQGKLRKTFEDRGIDLSVLPPEFNF